LSYLVDPQSVNFICGLALAVLAALAALLHNRDDRSLRWSWLIGFCGIQFAAELFQLLLFLAGQTAPLDAVGALGNVAASFALLEFGRRRVKPSGAQWLRPWIHAPLAAVSAAALAVGGLNGLDATARYAVTLPAAAIAAWAFWLSSRAHAKHVSAGLSTAALSVALYGVMTAINVEFGRAVASVGLLGGVWYEHRQLLMPANRTAIGRWWAPVAFAAVAIVGVCVVASIDEMQGGNSTVVAVQSQGAAAGATGLHVKLERPSRDDSLEKRYKQGISLLVIGGVVIVVWVLASRYSTAR
jgi:hypothetical protein